MSELVLERNWASEISSMSSELSNHNANTQAIEPYMINSGFFVQKEMESEWKRISYEKQIQEIENTIKSPEKKVLQVSHSQDSSLIMDAITLSNEFDDDWKHIITATANPMEVEDYLTLIEKQRNYPVFDRAWDFYDVITQIIEVGYQKQELFGDYEKIYTQVESCKESKDYPKAKQLLRQLQRRLKRCLPSEEDMIEQTRRTPHVTGDSHLNA